jgi:hypothetical protein
MRRDLVTPVVPWGLLATNEDGAQGHVRCKSSGGAWLGGLAALALLLSVAGAWAEEGPSHSTSDLAKASQNPVAAMISLPFENNATFNNGPDDYFVDVINVKPVIPMGLTEDWNLINRAIVPLAYQQGAFVGSTNVGGSTISGGTTEFVTPGEDLGSEFGLGDIVYQGFVSPKKPGKFIWGFGPQLNVPTGTGRMSANHWSMGPAAVGLMMPGHWVIGALISNVWSLGDGYGEDPADVNALTLQYFINYNMKGGWYLSMAPVITSNWEATDDNKWTVPVGGGVGRVFKLGKQHVNIKAATYYNAVSPKDASDWNFQFTWTFLFPK